MTHNEGLQVVGAQGIVEKINQNALHGIDIHRDAILRGLEGDMDLAETTSVLKSVAGFANYPNTKDESQMHLRERIIALSRVGRKWMTQRNDDAPEPRIRVGVIKPGIVGLFSTTENSSCPALIVARRPIAPFSDNHLGLDFVLPVENGMGGADVNVQKQMFQTRQQLVNMVVGHLFLENPAAETYLLRDSRLTEYQRFMNTSFNNPQSAATL